MFKVIPHSHFLPFLNLPLTFEEGSLISFTDFVFYRILYDLSHEVFLKVLNFGFLYAHNTTFEVGIHQSYLLEIFSSIEYYSAQ